MKFIIATSINQEQAFLKALSKTDNIKATKRLDKDMFPDLIFWDLIIENEKQFDLLFDLGYYFKSEVDKI